jgi:hypothetical protein
LLRRSRGLEGYEKGEHAAVVAVAYLGDIHRQGYKDIKEEVLADSVPING